MDKQKQIEKIKEMASDLSKYVIQDYGGVYFLETAEAFYNAGYRKIPELPQDTVLTVDDIAELLTIVARDTRKETAQKFAELKTVWKQRAKEYTDWAGNKVQAVTLDWLFADIDEICKEITEGKDV